MSGKSSSASVSSSSPLADKLKTNDANLAPPGRHSLSLSAPLKASVVAMASTVPVVKHEAIPVVKQEHVHVPRIIKKEDALFDV